MLHGLGAMPGTPVTILSDGAGEDPVLFASEAACVGPTRRMCWIGLHLSMQIQHVAQGSDGLA